MIWSCLLPPSHQTHLGITHELPTHSAWGTDGVRWDDWHSFVPTSRWVVSQTTGNTTYHFLPSTTFPCCQSYVILLGASLVFSQPCKQQFQRVETCLLVRISPVTSMDLIVVFFIKLWMFISEWLYCVSAFKYSGQIREDIKYQVSRYICCRLLTSPHIPHRTVGY